MYINVSTYKRIKKVYKILKFNFGIKFLSILVGFYILLVRTLVFIFSIFDYIFFPKVQFLKIKNPIVIVGNPRSGTTFLHHFLTRNNFGTGSQLWQMLYPSILLQKLIKPLLPFLEKYSPTRYHNTDAHKTSLTSVETDDASIFFRYLDGFFLYGFLLSWDENDLFDWVDPKKRDTSNRDFKWLKHIWKRVLIFNNQDRIIGKLFSISANMPKFQKQFPDAKVLYMVRDPLSVIPSGLSLVTGVLDKMFGFWSLSETKRTKFIENLYRGLVELLNRFHNDWIDNKINKDKVMIVHFDRMMNDFEGLMNDISEFLEIEVNEELKQEILDISESQKSFKSKHKYDLNKFGLSEIKIKKDCKNIYETFID